MHSYPFCTALICIHFILQADEAEGHASDPSKDKRASALPISATSSPSNIAVRITKKGRTPFQPGDRVCISGVKQGTLLYYGKTHIAHGAWCGIELDEPEGIHDGQIDGTRYFTCKNRHGIFAPSDRVERFIDKWSLSSPDDVESESSLATSPQKSRILPPGNLSKTFIKPKSKVSLLESDLSHFSSSDSLSDSVLSTESGEHISSPIKQSRLVKPKIVNVSGKYSEFLARNATSGNVRINDDLEPEFINDDSLTYEEDELSSKSDIGLLLKKQTSPVESSPSTNLRKSLFPTSRLPCLQKSTIAKEEGTKRPRLSSAPVELNQTYKLDPSFAVPLDEGIDPLSQDIQDTLDSDRRPFLNLTFTDSTSRPQQPLSSTIPDLLTPSAYYTIDSDDQHESNGTTNLQIGLPDKSTVEKSEVCSESNSVFLDQENSAKSSEYVSQKESESVGILSGKDLENTDLLKSIFSGILSSHQTGSIGSEVGSIRNQATPGSETVNVADVLTSILSSKELDQTDLLKNILCQIKSRGQTGSVGSETGSIGNQATPSDETFNLGAVVTSTPYVSKIPKTDPKNVASLLTCVEDNDVLPESESSARKCLSATYKAELKITQSENDSNNLNTLHSTYRIVDSQRENVNNNSASLLTKSASSDHTEHMHEDADWIEQMTDLCLSKEVAPDKNLLPSNDVPVPISDVPVPIFDLISTQKPTEWDIVDTHTRHEDDDTDNRGTSIREDTYAIEHEKEIIETSSKSAVDEMLDQNQLMADLTAGHTKKERPLSLMSVTSTDTGK